MKRSLFLGTFLFAAWTGAAEGPDPRVAEVRLRGGGAIVGQVLSEDPDRLVVDLGFTILRVPAEEVLAVGPAGASAAASGPAALAEADGLFRREPNRPVLAVKDQVERVGEAVVQIRTPTGLGSGFLVHPDGYVVTNHHVIAGETQISVILFRRDGANLVRQPYPKVRIVAFDPPLDLALLQIEDLDSPLPSLVFGDSDDLEQGQPVFAIGSPLGFERSVSEGIVSLRNRVVDGRIYIQTTTQVNPGNSGGPLFNGRGEVVGVANMKIVGAGLEGLGFAIPASTVRTFLRNRDAFAFDPRHPNAGFRYLPPPTPRPTARPAVGPGP